MKAWLIRLVRALLYWLSPDDAGKDATIETLRLMVHRAETEAYKRLQDAEQAILEAARLRALVVLVEGPIFDRVKALAIEQDAIEGRSGEAKRHQLLARIKKEYPELSNLTISKTIDAAVEALRG